MVCYIVICNLYSRQRFFEWPSSFHWPLKQFFHHDAQLRLNTVLLQPGLASQMLSTRLLYRIDKMDSWKANIDKKAHESDYSFILILATLSLTLT